MLFRKLSWIPCLAVAAGCTNGGSADAPDGDDFRDGAYHYVLGYDDESGVQIRGGAHQVVSFDDNGKTEAINSANFPNRLHPDFTTRVRQNVVPAGSCGAAMASPVRACSTAPVSRGKPAARRRWSRTSTAG